MTPKPDNLPAPADMDLATLLREMARVLHNAGGEDRGAGYSAELADAAIARADDLPPIAALSDRNAVHINMLRGTIATPTVEQIIHIYGADVLAAAIGARADDLPTKNALKDWRDIRGEDVDWEVNPISKRAGGYVEMMCNRMYWHSDTRSPKSCGGWRDLTLGEIADLGVKHWLRCTNIGPLGVDVIKWVIDEAANGRVAYRATKGRAADAYVPSGSPMPPAPEGGA